MMRSSSSAAHSLRAPPISASAPPPSNAPQARPGGGANRPAFERQGNLVAFGVALNPQLDVMVGSTRRAPAATPACRSLRASSATAAICGSASGLAEAGAGFALQRLELGVGRNQPAGLVEAAEDRPRFRRRASHAFPRPRVQRDRPARSPARCAPPAPDRRSCASNRSIAAPGSAIPSRSPMPASSPAPRSRDIPSHAEQRHHRARFAGKQLVDRRIRRNPGAAREDLGDEADFPFDARRQATRSSVRPPASSRKCTRPAVSASMPRSDRARRGRASWQLGELASRRNAAARSKFAPDARRWHGPGRRRCRAGRSSKATRHWPKRSRRRPRPRISAIAAAATAAIIDG